MDGWDEWSKWLEENVFFADEEGDDSDAWDLEEFLKENLPGLFTNLAPSVAWWQRWRIKGRPFNKDGESCLGEFGSLIGGE